MRSPSHLGGQLNENPPPAGAEGGCVTRYYFFGLSGGGR